MGNGISTLTPRGDAPNATLNRTSSSEAKPAAAAKDTLSQGATKPAPSQPSAPTLAALATPATRAEGPIQPVEYEEPTTPPSKSAQDPIQPVEYEASSLPASSRANLRELALAFVGGIRSACSALFDTVTRGPQRRANALAEARRRAEYSNELHGRAQAAIDKLGDISKLITRTPQERHRAALEEAQASVSKLGPIVERMEDNL